MTYKNNFVVCVKVDGKIMRDSGEEVYIPFGCEYTLLLKNLEARKAVALVSIDGKPMEHKVIVPAHGEVELERFLEEDLDRGYRFKFIEKTKEVSEHRGDDPCDGLITVEYWFERQVEEVPYIKWTPIEKPYYPRPWGTDIHWSNDNHTFGSSTGNLRCAKGIAPMTTMSCFNVSTLNDSVSFDSEGITVKGEDSNQSFRYGHVGTLEVSSHTITLKLKGLTSNKSKPVQVPVYVNTRLICSSCGKSHKSSVRFCSSCGTRLV